MSYGWKTIETLKVDVRADPPETREHFQTRCAARMVELRRVRKDMHPLRRLQRGADQVEIQRRDE